MASAFATLALQVSTPDSAASTFSQAWALWGTRTRIVAADPIAHAVELQEALELFDALASYGESALSEKQMKQIEVCRSSIRALLERSVPERAPSSPPAAAHKPHDKPGTPYAGLRQAPLPHALPSPSMFFGSKAAVSPRKMSADAAGGHSANPPSAMRLPPSSAPAGDLTATGSSANGSPDGESARLIDALSALLATNPEIEASTDAQPHPPTAISQARSDTNTAPACLPTATQPTVAAASRPSDSTTPPVATSMSTHATGHDLAARSASPLAAAALPPESMSKTSSAPPPGTNGQASPHQHSQPPLPTALPLAPTAPPPPQPPQPPPPSPPAPPPQPPPGLSKQSLVAMLAGRPEPLQKRLLGEQLYAALCDMPHVADPAKVTGMLLEMETQQLIEILTTPQLLFSTVRDALAALKAAHAPRQPHAHAAARTDARTRTHSPAHSPAQRPAPPGALPPQAPLPPADAPAKSSPPPPREPPPNAKTRLCKFWVQRGMCLQGDKCTFAHGTSDMTLNAQAKQNAKVTTQPLAFRPLQAMARPKAAVKSAVASVDDAEVNV